MTEIELKGPVIRARNEFTKVVDTGLVLHPENPDEGDGEPASARFVGVDLEGKAGFCTTLRTNDERCRPVVLRVEVVPDDGATPISLGEVELAGSVDREWLIPFPELPSRADLVLSCRLGSQATDNLYSGISVIRPVISAETSAPPSGPAQAPASVSVPQSTDLLPLLLDGRIAEYLEAAADAPGVIWILHHIAKTAGTSLLNEITSVLEPSINVFGNARSQFPDVESALQHHLPTLQAGSVRFATGHFNRHQVERIREGHSAPRPITFLRHPITRYVSQYRYMLTPAEPTHEEVRRRYPTLAAYTEAPETHNVMFNTLRKSPDDTVDDVVDDLERNYAFVGLTERYEFCRRVVFTLLGSEPPARPLVENRTASIPENEIEWSRDIERLREINDMDLALYAHFTERFLGIERPLSQLLDARGK